MSTAAPETITRHVAIAGNPKRFGGMALDPLTGDLLISVRDDNTVRRISNPGTGSQSEVSKTARSVGTMCGEANGAVGREAPWFGVFVSVF